MIFITKTLVLLFFIIYKCNGQLDGPAVVQHFNNETTITANSSSVGSIERYHNATEPSFLYVVQIELKSSRVEESYAKIEKRLNKLVEMAFVLAAYKHRKQIAPVELTTDNVGYTTKIIKKRTSGELTYIHFITYVGNEPVIGEVVADDLTLLSVSQISAILRYPLGKIISDRDIENESATKWWFLIAVIGAGVIIIIIGWFCLFLFYNTCGYMYGTDEGDYMTRGQRAKRKKELIINPLPSQCELSEEQPNDTLPSDGSNPTVGVRKPKLNKKMQRSCRTLSEIHLERRIKNERENIRKAIQEALNKAVAENKEAALAPLPSSFGQMVVDTDVEVAHPAVIAKSEKKRRHTKIGPITAVTTTTTTNEQQGETSEISRVSSVSTASPQQLKEFDATNLPETSFKLVKKQKHRKDSDVKSEPESDYGSSLDDEKSKEEETEIGTKAENHEDARVRPMTAKRQRTSLFGGLKTSQIPLQPHAWTVYHAGDKVSSFWNNNRIHDHPTPSSPTENGIIELSFSKSMVNH